GLSRGGSTPVGAALRSAVCRPAETNEPAHIMTSPGRWATVERLYHAALAQTADKRPAYLAEACAGDEQLRREVESLLAQDVSADAGLTGGAVGAAAGPGRHIRPSGVDGRRLV